MRTRISLWLAAGALALALSYSAYAQLPPPPGLAGVMARSGTLGPNTYVPADVPSTYVEPNYIPYLVPQPIYVPVPMTPDRPPMEPVQVSVVTLRSSGALTSLQVRLDSVVTWVNAGKQSRTIVIEPVLPLGTNASVNRQTGVSRPNRSLSMAFHLAGAYDYYLQNQPSHRGRITVD